MISDLNKGISSIEYNHLNMPTKVTVTGNSNAGTLDYVYAADRTKLRKINSNGTTTDYIGNFVYENGSLKQISQPEGYIEPDGNGWQYVYRYTDIWGNTRLTYADDNNDGNIDASSEIRREQNYYPFGLEHKGYNNISYGAKNNLKTYQAQEFTEDLGLNTHEWKYRISDPAIGRFWQIDPLAESYTYNSTYAFQENKLGMGVELEGLEVGYWESQALVNWAVNKYNNIVGGAQKMVEGSTNMLNDAVSGNMASRKAENNFRETQGQAPIVDANLEKVLGGAAAIDNELPDKQDLRNVADGAELAGDVIKVGGVGATIVSGGTASPVSVPAIGVGEVISDIGLGLNIAIDLTEGEKGLKKAGQRIGVEVFSAGMGSFVRKSGAGDEIAEKATNIVSGKAGQEFLEAGPKKEDEKQ